MCAILHQLYMVQQWILVQLDISDVFACFWNHAIRDPVGCRVCRRRHTAFIIRTKF